MTLYHVEARARPQHRRYCPQIGGHAPGHLREAFADAAYDYATDDVDAAPPAVQIGDKTMALRDLTGLLWNCTDTMPNWLCNSLQNLVEHPHWEPWNGRTYAPGARLVRAYIDRKS